MNLCAHGSPLAARGEQTHQRGDSLPLHRIVDVPLFLPALDEPGPSQDIEMMGQGRSRDRDSLLDFADRHLPPRLHEHEKDLEATEVRERLEGLDMAVVGRQLRYRQAGYRLHISKCMEMRNACQSRRRCPSALSTPRSPVLRCPATAPRQQPEIARVADRGGGTYGCDRPGGDP